jgi:hypothetical protein
MAKKAKLPKRIGGVKIPKKLRERGAPLYALMGNPMVRNVVADMLAAGLLAAADAMSRQPKVKKAGKATKHAMEDVGEAAGTGAANVGKVLAFIAREGAHAIKNR